MADLSSKRILIADDDPGIVEAIEMMLAYEGYQVSSTHSGSAVLQLQDNFPDLVLLDIWMSGEDGRDICRKLKCEKATQNLPVLMISASRDVKQSAMEAGADDFLAKPFEMDDLLSKITRLTSR